MAHFSRADTLHGVDGLCHRKINPDLQPIVHNIWIEKSPKSPRRVKDIEHNARGQYIQSNNLGADFDLSPRGTRIETSGDKTFSPLGTRRTAANPSGGKALTNPESPQNVEAGISPFGVRVRAADGPEAGPDSVSESLASTRGSVRFIDSSSTQTERNEGASRGHLNAPDFKSTGYRCGSYDPRVPPPMLGRVQPLVTLQRGESSQLFPALPAAGCPLLRVRMNARPYGGDRLHRPWACDG